MTGRRIPVSPRLPSRVSGRTETKTYGSAADNSGFQALEERLTTLDFVTALFCQVDGHLPGIPQHPHATLWPSEIVTLGILHALKGVGNRAFYRWLTRDYRAVFPRLPERTRLFRLFMTHQDWTQAFLASPTVLGVIDTYGIEPVAHATV